MKKLYSLFLVASLCLVVHAETNPERDSLYIKLRMARNEPGNALANAYSDLGDYYMYKIPDSANYYFQKGLSHIKEKTAPVYAGLLCNVAAYSQSIGEMDKALSQYHFAYSEAERLQWNDGKVVAASSMGVLYRRKEMPDSAFYFYNEALKVAENQQDMSAVANLYTNIAVLYANSSRLKESIPYAKKGIEAAELSKQEDIIQYIYSYNTYGSILVKLKHFEEATPILLAALNGAEEIGSSQMEIKNIIPILRLYDLRELRDSVFYYINKAEKLLPTLPLSSTEVLGYYEVKGQLLGKYGRYKESLEAFEIIEKHRGQSLQSPIDRLYYHLGINYRGLNKHEKAYEYMKEAYLAKDSLFALEVQKQMSDLTIKYKTKEKEWEIAQLKQTQAEQYASMIQRIACLVIALLIVSSICLVLLYKKRAARKELDLRLAQQYIDGLESERKRLAKELHDGVCNDLLGIQMYMKRLQNEKLEKPQTVFDLLEQARADVRFISHELMPPSLQYTNLHIMLLDYTERVERMHGVRIQYTSSPIGLDWSQIPHQKAYELYRIVQEAITNAILHGDVDTIKISLSVDEFDILSLSVQDNGQTHKEEMEGKRGIGLRTIADRVKCINGVYTFSREDEGTILTVNLKIS